MLDLTLTAAAPTEFAAALDLLFRNTPATERAAIVTQALGMLQSGELDPQGLWIGRRSGRIVSVMLAAATPGAVGLVWPPQTADAPDRPFLEDALVTTVTHWLRQRGVKLAQALLPPPEAPQGASLERNGFEHITRLLFLRRWLDDLAATDLMPSRRLTFAPYGPETHAAFAATLARSYEGTLDCPELEGTRTMDEIILGHQSQDGYSPAHWWLALENHRPVAVLLVNAARDDPAWEVVYVGVIPTARGRGLGQILMRQALAEAKLAGMRVVSLSVDNRNVPALALYRRLGFEQWDEREVFLAKL